MDNVKLFVARNNGTKGYTAGRMYWNGDLLCYTLEDEVREVDGEPVAQWKIKGETAIPRGTYRVILSHSNHFGRELPEVLNVPGYVGIRIHSGNKAQDTEGCILVGEQDVVNGWLGDSKKAEGIVVAKINEAINSGAEVWLTVI